MPLMQDPPARVKARTNATGSLTTFTVDETAISPGYRSFTQAVADGDLVSGTDIFPVIVIDTTVTNGPKLFQIATATWNNTTKQLTIVTNYQPAGPPSWGVGWRDVVVINLPALFMFTTGGTMTGLVHLLLSGAAISPNANTAFVAQRSATTGTVAYGSIVSGTAAVAGLNLGDTANELAGGVHYDNNTDTLYLRTAATNGPRVDSSGVLRNSAGTAYLTSAAGASVPAGSVTDWYQAAAPSGWTRVTTVNDRVPIIVSAGSPGTTNATTWDITGLTADAHTLTESEIPSHTHNISYGLAQAVDGGAPGVDTIGSGSNTATSASSGGGDPHSHAVSSTGTWRPPAAYMLLASKDA